jgi:hypothetical protein
MTGHLGFVRMNGGHTARVRRPDEIDSEVLLKQGDELLKSSRELLEDMDDAIGTTPVPDIDLS